MITYDVVSASLKHIKNANKIEGVTNSSNWYISLELEDPDDFYATAGQYIIMDTSKTHRAFEAWKELFKAKCLGEDEKFDKTKDYTLTAENIDNPKMKQIKGVVFMSKVLPQPMARKNPLIGPHDRRDLSISVAVSWSGIGLKRAITETAKHPMILKNSIRRRCNVSLRRMKPAVPVNNFRP